MPFTVITLTNAPDSLRGDLSKWMQEIAVGVYVGNFNSRVREQLWQHVCDNVKRGEATISYATRNEIGYKFDNYNTKQEVIECDGIPLIRYPFYRRETEMNDKHGFSKAYHSHMQYIKSKSNQEKKIYNDYIPAYVLLDVETTGLDFENCRIIEIGAIKVNGEYKEKYHRLFDVEGELPEFISKLTGITKKLLCSEGVDRYEGFEEFRTFVGDLPLVGFNIKFDITFLEKEFNRFNIDWKPQGYIDVLSVVKKEKMFLDNYKFSNVLQSYGIDIEVKHRALQDVELLMQLVIKLNEFELLIQKKCEK